MLFSYIHFYKDIKFEIENYNKILINIPNYKGFMCGDDCEIGYDELMKKVDFNIQTNVIKSHKNKLANTKVNIDFRFNKEVDELANQARSKIQYKK